MRPALVCALLALCLPAAALADGPGNGPKGPPPFTGLLTANGSGSVTVTSKTASLTCAVPDRAAGSLAKLKVGTPVKIACRKTATGLVLAQLQPLPPPKHDSGTGSSSGDGDNHQGTGSTTTTTTTSPTAPTQPPPPPPSTAPKPKSAVGTVFFLSATGVGLRPDGGGEVLTCAITTAPDSVAAAAKLTLNGHFGIVCRPDGGHFVLSGATPAP